MNIIGYKSHIRGVFIDFDQQLRYTQSHVVNRGYRATYMMDSLRFVWLLPIALAASIASAETYEVDQAAPSCSDLGGQPFCSMNAALAVAIHGDTVLVHPGEYVENIDFTGDDIHLISSQGPSMTIIRAITGQVVRVGPSGSIEGFTIRGGFATSGAGMAIAGAGTIVRGNVFENNRQLSDGYGAAIAGATSSPIIDGNLFENNSCDTFLTSGVVAFVGISSPTIINNVFRFNPCRALNLTLTPDSQPIVAFNTIVQNQVGIRIDRRHPTDEHIYRNNIFVGNDVGLSVEFGDEADNPVWENNILFENGINYETIQDLTGVAGNTDHDPVFADRDGLDYRLGANSPAVDAGANLGGVAEDFLRNDRITDGNNDGISAPDIGAFELSRPIANAGADFVAARIANVLLDGSQSFDIDGHITTFSWEQTGGAAVELMGAATAHPNFLAPATSGVVQIVLEVTDDIGASSTDALQIRINAAPNASAGADFVLNQGETGLLDGSLSSDEDGRVEQFVWQQIAGPTIIVINADSSTPSFVAPNAAALLTFKLTVTDNDGTSTDDNVSVAVNLIPIADAGPDITVSTGASVSVDGSESVDPDGSDLLFAWQQTAGDAVIVTGSDSMTIGFTAPEQPQTLQFRLTVTDEHGAQKSDIVSIAVRSGMLGSEGGGGGAVGFIPLLILILVICTIKFSSIRLKLRRL